MLSYQDSAGLLPVGRQGRVYVGTAAGVTDRMQHWFEAGACDGFTMLSPYFPGPLELLVDTVVPELQRRGLFRTEYGGGTLRENLGVPFRASRYTSSDRTAG